MSGGLCILVVSQSRKRLDQLLDALAASPDEHHLVGRLDKALNLPRWVEEVTPDVIVMEAESPSRDTLEQICIATQSTPRPIVMFAQEAEREAIQSAARAGVSCYVVDGLGKERVLPLLELAQAQFEAADALRHELQRARQELQDHKLVERAKARLIKEAGLSEEAAYQRLRRLAMDQRLRLVDAARHVLEAGRRTMHLG